MPTTAYTEQTPASIQINSNGLEMQIKINEINTSPTVSTESHRKWLELQKYNPHSEIAKQPEVETIDIDNDDSQEISGSGTEDNEDGDDEDRIISLPTRSKPAINATVNEQTTPVRADSLTVHSVNNNKELPISGILLDHTLSTHPGTITYYLSFVASPLLLFIC